MNFVVILLYDVRDFFIHTILLIVHFKIKLKKKNFEASNLQLIHFLRLDFF